MRPAFPSSALYPIAETLLIAAAGGVAFVLIGFPAGLVTGSMLAVTVAALLGRPMKIPLLLARVCYVVTGTLLGAVVTPATLAGIATWPLSSMLYPLASLAYYDPRLKHRSAIRVFPFGLRSSGRADLSLRRRGEDQPCDQGGVFLVLSPGRAHRPA